MDKAYTTELFKKVHELLRSDNMKVEVRAMAYLDNLYDVLSNGQSEERSEAANLLRMVAPMRDERTVNVLADRLQKERDWAVFRSILGALRGVEAIGTIPLLTRMLNEAQYAEVQDSLQGAIDYLEGH
jgi:hypothetical protein